VNSLLLTSCTSCAPPCVSIAHVKESGNTQGFPYFCHISCKKLKTTLEPCLCPIVAYKKLEATLLSCDTLFPLRNWKQHWNLVCVQFLHVRNWKQHQCLVCHIVSLKKLETNWNLILSHCSCMKLKMYWCLYLIVTYN
jgi:hypothetical protein